MARTRRANRYCVDCGARLVYYPRLSNPKAPNEHRVLVYACPDCTEDFEKPKMFSIKRNVAFRKNLQKVNRRKIFQKTTCIQKEFAHDGGI